MICALTNMHKWLRLSFPITTLLDPIALHQQGFRRGCGRPPLLYLQKWSTTRQWLPVVFQWLQGHGLLCVVGVELTELEYQLLLYLIVTHRVRAVTFYWEARRAHIGSLLGWSTASLIRNELWRASPLVERRVHAEALVLVLEARFF